MSQRPYDIVLLGATGFTGGLTAERLAEAMPDGARWALAGRNHAKLEDVRRRLGADVDLLVADASDEASLARVAASTKVVATTVGPYLRHGEPLVAACAKAGTDYLDLTGEQEFVDTMYLRHHDAAVASGARLVHSCGFDSIPHDLGVQFCVEQLPDGVPVRITGYVRAEGLISGGTFDSATTAMSRMREMSAAAKQRREKEGLPPGRRVRVFNRPAWDRDRKLIGLPMPTIDPEVVRRSALLSPDYGPDFAYSHVAGVRNPLAASGIVAGTGMLVAAVQVGPLRRTLVRMSRPGTGPSEERRARSWFEVVFRGEGGGRSVTARVTGGDAGYTETSKMLAQSALCLAYDELPETSGQITTAVAMGPALRERLMGVGITFEVVPDVAALGHGRPRALPAPQAVDVHPSRTERVA